MPFEGFAASLECRGQPFAKHSESARSPALQASAPIWVPELPLLWARRVSASEGSPHAGRPPSRPSAAQAAGLRYEARALEWLQGEFGAAASLASPWFVYCDARGRRHYCQPDFLVDLGTTLVCVEIKARWTASAWWQLRRLYEPVLREALGRPVQCVVLCGSYDPAISCPEEVSLISSLSEVRSDFPLLVKRF